MLYYRKMGRGKPIMLIHGFTSSSEKFMHAPKYLKGYKFILPDLPGHGRSLNFKRVSWEVISKELSKVLRKERIKEYVLGGHSLGGMVALQHYVRRKKGIKGLIVLNSTAFYSPNLSKEQYVRHLAYVYENPKRSINHFIETMIQRYKFFKNVEPNVLKQYLEMIFNHDVRSKLNDFNIPAMLLKSENDILITKDDTEETAMLLSAKLYSVPGGHNCFYENSRKVYSYIRRFLKCINY